MAFCLPYLQKMIFPTILYPSIPTYIAFWVGFLFILTPNKKINDYNSYIRYARYAVVLNIVLTITVWILMSAIHSTESFRGFPVYLLRFLNFLCNPMDYFFEIMSPKPTQQLADGTVQTTYTYHRMLLTIFFNLFAYAASGAFIRKLIEKR